MNRKEMRLTKAVKDVRTLGELGGHAVNLLGTLAVVVGKEKMQNVTATISRSLPEHTSRWKKVKDYFPAKRLT